MPSSASKATPNEVYIAYYVIYYECRKQSNEIFSLFYSSDITIKDISIYKFAIVFVTLRRSFQNYSHANLIIQLKLKPTQIYLSTLFHIY